MGHGTKGVLLRNLSGTHLLLDEPDLRFIQRRQYLRDVDLHCPSLSRVLVGAAKQSPFQVRCGRSGEFGAKPVLNIAPEDTAPSHDTPQLSSCPQELSAALSVLDGVPTTICPTRTSAISKAAG